MKVYAPNNDYTGVSASVAFCNGVGETDNPHLLKWFRTHGYKVEEHKEDVHVTDSPVEEATNAEGTKKTTKKA